LSYSNKNKNSGEKIGLFIQNKSYTKGNEGGLVIKLQKRGEKWVGP
jgi:hypothetical protein